MNVPLVFLCQFFLGNQERVLLAIFTSVSMTGTSTRPPTTVATAAPELRLKIDSGTRGSSERTHRANEKSLTAIDAHTSTRILIVGQHLLGRHFST